MDCPAGFLTRVFTTNRLALFQKTESTACVVFLLHAYGLKKWFVVFLCYIFPHVEFLCSIFPRVVFCVIFFRMWDFCVRCFHEWNFVLYISVCEIWCYIFLRMEYRAVIFCVWNFVLYFSVCGVWCYIFRVLNFLWYFPRMEFSYLSWMFTFILFYTYPAFPFFPNFFCVWDVWVAILSVWGIFVLLCCIFQRIEIGWSLVKESWRTMQIRTEQHLNMYHFSGYTALG